MTVSIIIPTYNEAKYIKECLLSLLDQSLKPKEIIIVDDGSMDNTLSVISQLPITNYQFRVLHQQHKGAGAARNRGAEKATGDILVFVDADMEFDQDFLKHLTAPIRLRRTKGTFSKDELIKNWDNPWARSWNYCLGLKTHRAIPKTYPNQSPVFRAILKSEFDKVNGFDEARGYDDDWSLSEKLGYKANLASQAIYYHSNPDSFAEIFRQARWRASRKYKFGIFGGIAMLLKTKMTLFRQLILFPSLHFFLASIAFYFGTKTGLILKLFSRKVSK